MSDPFRAANQEQSQAVMNTIDPTLQVILEDEFVQVNDTTRGSNQAWGYGQGWPYLPLKGSPLVLADVKAIASYFAKQRTIHPESYRTCSCHSALRKVAKTCTCGVKFTGGACSSGCDLVRSDV